MKRQIKSPHKINWKMYSLILAISVLTMIIAVVLYEKNQNTIFDVTKNLVFGCVASTLVAFLIEIENVKEKNEKAFSVYDAVYSDLQCQIMLYLDTWSRLCCVAFKDKDYRQEKHTWMEWYDITKTNYLKCDNNRQTELMHFFNDQLILCIDGVEKSLRQIEGQRYILNINGVYDESLKRILSDYSFEFYAAKLTLEREYDKDDFWRSFDAIKEDLINYINNWVDIKYFNYCKFKPYGFYDDKSEILRAILESEQIEKK